MSKYNPLAHDGKSRSRMWSEYADVKDWDGHTSDDLLNCLAALQLEAMLDLRDQNARIIELLQRPVIQNASIVSLSHLPDERWLQLQAWIAEIAKESK